jgi:hypothetical protein
LALEYQGWPLTSQDGSLILATLPAVQGMRELSNASVIEGRLYEEVGLADGAAASYFDALAAGASAGSGPTLIESIVGASMQNTAANAILDLEASPAGQRLDYTAMSVLLQEEYRSPRPLGETVQFERASFLDTVQRMFSYDAESGAYVLDAAKAADYFRLPYPAPDEDKISARTNRLAEIGFDGSVADGNTYFDALADAFAQPYPRAQQMLEAAERQFDEGSVSPLLYGTLAFSRYHQVRTKADALQRATRLVTQLNAYRQEHGKYPDSLDVFGGADFTVDPFTGSDLSYQRAGASFRLYSLGVNGADDSGVNDPSGDAGDIVYWPRPGPQ